MSPSTHPAHHRPLGIGRPQTWPPSHVRLDYAWHTARSMQWLLFHRTIAISWSVILDRGPPKHEGRRCLLPAFSTVGVAAARHGGPRAVAALPVVGASPGRRWWRRASESPVHHTAGLDPGDRPRAVCRRGCHPGGDPSCEAMEGGWRRLQLQRRQQVGRPDDDVHLR